MSVGVFGETRGVHQGRMRTSQLAHCGIYTWIRIQRFPLLSLSRKGVSRPAGKDGGDMRLPSCKKLDVCQALANWPMDLLAIEKSDRLGLGVDFELGALASPFEIFHPIRVAADG
jgi:hypothetical protein